MNRSPIEISQVAHVYSGINGKCCCGCSGKHTYASAHAVWGGENRGYPVDAEDINDRTVKLIVNKINRAPELLDNEQDFVSAVSENGNRIYIAYLRRDDESRTTWDDPTWRDGV